ncbi:hypothetical protein BGX21_000154 [Mortierella sp. AD011]|nr:hypothetical protein BGX21_000154 [Mortierella sp. AD011]
MRTVANSSPDCRNLATSSLSSGNSNNGHENRNQTNRNSLLHGNDNETWGEDMISTLASSASLLSPKTPTPTSSTPPTNKRSARTTKTAAISGDTSEHNCYSISNTADPFERPSSVPKATTSSGLFTPVSQTSTLHSSAQLQLPMSTANASSSACRSTNISSTIRSSPGKTGRRLSTLNHQLQRSTVSLPTSGSCLLGNSSDHNAVIPSNSNNSMDQITSQHQRSSPSPGQRKAASTPVSSFQMDIVDSSTTPSTQYNQIYQHHPQVPSAFIMSHAPFGSMRISPSSTHTGSISANSTQPSFSGDQTPRQPAIELAAIPDTHSGVIMASPGPGLSSSTPRNISPGDRWNHLMGFVRAVVSYTLLSRLFSRRPNYSSGNISSTSPAANSWSVIR